MSFHQKWSFSLGKFGKLPEISAGSLPREELRGLPGFEPWGSMAGTSLYPIHIHIYIYICINIYIYMYKYIQDMVISKWYNHNSIYRKERKNHDDVKVHSEVLLFFVYSSHWILKNPAHGSNIWVPSGITLLWKLVHWSVELIMFNWLRGFSNAKKTLCKWLVKSGTWGHQRGHGDFPAVVPRCWMV